MAENKDRISKYLVEANKSVIFDELSDDYLTKAGVLDILHGVPVPLIFDDEGMSTLTLALGMSRIVGGDNNFVHGAKYIEFIKRVLGDVAVKVLVGEGAKAGQVGDYEVACMHFRTALVLDPRSRDALYLYGRACKDAYEVEEKSEEYVGLFKAESLEVFEILTMLHPMFPMGYYFLGYGYLNLGLYTKARLTFESFVQLVEGMDDINLEDGTPVAGFKPVEGLNAEVKEVIGEVHMRIDMLEEPEKIERACNLVMSGNYQKGLVELEQYTEGRYKDWWPLWYYLGVARSAMMDAEGAIKAFKKVLVLSPSNVQTMQELVDIYDALGDQTNRDKYLKKIEIVNAAC